MINRFHQSVCQALKRVKDCTVYREDVPQDFKRPCFMVTIYEQNPTRGINGKLKNSIRTDILYFPLGETGDGYQEECWDIGQSLQREFAPQGFKIKKRNLKITDKVLHFMFDTDYREYLEDSTVRMQEMSQDTAIKEE